ncbi:hypothetical protein DFJ74DRAFT_768592 [Hyaloraphidium curvatum]|nr:hypothetical protein DFJ74DRAFT_768592 [Hyaloraphidium curvatum]
MRTAAIVLACLVVLLFLFLPPLLSAPAFDARIAFLSFSRWPQRRKAFDSPATVSSDAFPPLVIAADVLFVIFTFPGSPLTPAFSRRLDAFPLLNRSDPHVRLWSSGDRNLTFAYVFYTGNASIGQPNLPIASSFDPSTRTLTVPVGADYRSLPHRTAAMLLRQHAGFWPHGSRVDFELLVRLDDDSFTCFDRLFAGLYDKVRFAKDEPDARAKAEDVWGGPTVVAFARSDPNDRWYGSWKAGERGKLKIYGLDDAMVGIWVHKTLEWKEWEEYGDSMGQHVQYRMHVRERGGG